MTGPLRERSSRTRPPLLVLVLAILLVLALFHPASCESNEREGEGDGGCESSGAKGQESFKSRLIHALRTSDRWRSSTGEGPSLSTRWEADASARPHADSEVGSEKSSVQTETGGKETAEGDASNDEAEDRAEDAAAAKEEEETVEEEVPADACGAEPEQTERETEEQDERGAEHGGAGRTVGEDKQPGGGSSATEAPRGGWKRLRSSSSGALRTQSAEGADPKAGLSLRSSDGSAGSRTGGGDGESGSGEGPAGGTPPLRGMQKGSGQDLKVLTPWDLLEPFCHIFYD